MMQVAVLATVGRVIAAGELGSSMWLAFTFPPEA